MEKLVTVKDVKNRYGCSLPTARKYIRQCNPYMENPLTTYEWAFREWEASRTVTSEPRKEIARITQLNPTYVPRKR